MMFWYGNGMGGWGYALMAFGSVLFWALVVVAVVALVRYLARPAPQLPSHPPAPAPQIQTPTPTPEQVLADRFARGEIDEDEYRRRRAILRAGGPEPAPKH